MKNKYLSRTLALLMSIVLFSCNYFETKKADVGNQQMPGENTVNDNLDNTENAQGFFDSPKNVYVCKDKNGLEEKLLYTVNDDNTLAKVFYFTSVKTNIVQMLITKREQNYCEVQFPNDKKNTYKINSEKNTLTCLNPDGSKQVFLKTKKRIKIETFDCAEIKGEFNYEGPSTVTFVGLDKKTLEFPYFQKFPTYFDNKQLDLFTPPSLNAQLNNKKLRVTYHLEEREFPLYGSDKTGKANFLEIINIESLK